MQVKNVAHLWIARILSRDPGWIGLGGAEFLPDLLGTVENADGISQALGHLGLAVQSGNSLCLSENRLRLREELSSRRELGAPLTCNLASQFEMLHLIFPDRDQISAI